MPTASATRNDRIELRASREQKRILAAAAYERLDLTSFVMRTALPAAEEIVARHERISLTARDSARVLELIVDLGNTVLTKRAVSDLMQYAHPLYLLASPVSCADADMIVA